VVTTVSLEIIGNNAEVNLFLLKFEGEIMIFFFLSKEVGKSEEESYEKRVNIDLDKDGKRIRQKRWKRRSKRRIGESRWKSKEKVKRGIDWRVRWREKEEMRRDTRGKAKRKIGSMKSEARRSIKKNSKEKIREKISLIIWTTVFS
jgi:hypothetical protein